MIIFTFTCPRRNTRWLLHGSRTSFTGRRHDRSHCAGTLTDSRHTHSDTGPSLHRVTNWSRAYIHVHTCSMTRLVIDPKLYVPFEVGLALSFY